MKKIFLIIVLTTFSIAAKSQISWYSVDSINAEMPAGVRLYKSSDSLDAKANIAYYLKVKLNDKHLQFDVDTSLGRRFTPTQYYERNNKPLLVVNGSFFNFDKHQNLNVVIKNGKVVGHNLRSVQRKVNGKPQKFEIYRSAIGINKKGEADVAWIRTDSGSSKAYGKQEMDSVFNTVAGEKKELKKREKNLLAKNGFKQWKINTAIGGGPVLVQDAQIKIYNEQEKMFDGKEGLTEKHPRTAMGYTADGHFIILVIEGRNPGIAEGASLEQEAKILVDLGCIEALNLDGGGSSCMLVKGKETIKPSDKSGQRPVPAVFLIRAK